MWSDKLRIDIAYYVISECDCEMVCSVSADSVFTKIDSMDCLDNDENERESRGGGRSCRNILLGGAAKPMPNDVLLQRRYGCPKYREFSVPKQVITRG